MASRDGAPSRKTTTFRRFHRCQQQSGVKDDGDATHHSGDVEEVQRPDRRPNRGDAEVHREGAPEEEMVSRFHDRVAAGAPSFQRLDDGLLEQDVSRVCTLAIGRSHAKNFTREGARGEGTRGC